MSDDQPTGREVLEKTLREVAGNRGGATTATERMRAAFALVMLLKEMDSGDAAEVRKIISAT